MAGPKIRTTRKLQITPGGWWYVIFTVAIGVVAMVSGNNIFYLVESLLLSGLILSGVLSERAVSAIYFEIKRQAISADGPAKDRIFVRNRKRFPVYCIEIGEWCEGRFEPIAFVPKVSGRSETWIKSIQRFQQRGMHFWDGIAVATSYPFGFARKIRLIREPGTRLVWPRNTALFGQGRTEDLKLLRTRTGPEVIEGEVRQMTPADDFRDVVWTVSARGMDPLVRMRKTTETQKEVSLDVRRKESSQFEIEIEKAAQPFHSISTNTDATLILLSSSGRKKYKGKKYVLDLLATIQPELRSEPGGSAQ